MEYILEHAMGTPKDFALLRATLTATTNPSLKDKLPLDGLVEIERTIDGECQRVRFMPDVPEGEDISFVPVPNAEFTFTFTSLD